MVRRLSIILLIPILIFAKNHTNSVSDSSIVFVANRNVIDVTSYVIHSDELNRLPLIDFQDFIVNQSNIILNNDDLHMQGGRTGEIGFFINGSSTINPLTNKNAIRIIPQAIQYIQISPGQYNADMGGYISGIIQSEMKSGSGKFTGSIELRTDGFGDPEKGKKWFDTYMYGHQTGVATLSGPLLKDKIRFFIAGEYRKRDDNIVRFSEGFEFENLKDDGYYASALKDSINIKYPDGFTPQQSFRGTALNANVTFDYPVKVKLSAMIKNDRSDAVTAPMLNVLNDRVPYDDYFSSLITAKFSKDFNKKSTAELQLSYYTSGSERGDSWFDHDWQKWFDTTAVNKYSSNNYDDLPKYNNNHFAPKIYDYWINGFQFHQNGFLPDYYYKNDQQYIAAKFDYANKINEYHELKFGFDWRKYTIRHFEIAPSVVPYVLSENYDYHTNYTEIKDVPTNQWQLIGNISTYGYDLYGKVINKTKNYFNEEENLVAIADAPKEPQNISFYLQDKMTYENIKINAGLRVDYIDSDDKIFNSLTADDIGIDIIYIPDSAWKKQKTFLEVQPRINFTFVANPSTVLSFNYGKYVQMPAYNHLYTATSFEAKKYMSNSGHYYTEPIGFGLEPIRSDNFELGMKHYLDDIVNISINGFYKNVKNHLKTMKQNPEYITFSSYEKIINGDNAIYKGFDLELSFNRVNRLLGKFQYTFTDAMGTGSTYKSYQSAIYSITSTPQTMVPMDYARKHVGSINLDYRFDKNDGGPIFSQSGVNLLFNFSSGHPFTKSIVVGGGSNMYDVGVSFMDDTRSRRANEPIGNSLTPWNFTTDIKIEKSFDIGMFKATTYLLITNLFNRKNVLNVYELTGSDEDAGVNDWIKNYSQHQGGVEYIKMFEAINFTNGQSYWDILGKQLWDHPRQIHVGIKFFTLNKNN